MNIYHISPDIIRFNIFNLLGDEVGLDGQYGFYYHLRTQECLAFKRGGFGNLTSFPKGDMKLFALNQEQITFLTPHLNKRLTTACYYDKNHINHKGRFLLDYMNNSEYPESLKAYFVWEKDDYADKEQKSLNEQAKNILDKSA